IWNSALALPSLFGVGVGLALAGLRPRLSAAARFAAGLFVGASPLLVARVIGASGASTVTAVRPRWPWLGRPTPLGRAAPGPRGPQVPLVVDGPERAALPVLAVVALAIGLAVLMVVGSLTRRAWPLLGWAACLEVTFALSRRTGPDEIRYLYGLLVPTL